MKTEFRSFTSALWERLLSEALQRRHLAAGRDAAEARFGELMHHRGFVSDHVASRHVDVWLPPNYQDSPSRRFPVIYMHDGQNLFDPKTSFIGVDWGIDEAMRDLTAVRRARAAIVVGIWNTPQRSQEYMPQRALEMLPVQLSRRRNPLSDRYLKFLVEDETVH
jgi:predicted alpha/beta superfamily hydrolase